MLATAIAARTGASALTAIEYLDHTVGDAHIDLGANERVWNRI